MPIKLHHVPIIRISEVKRNSTADYADYADKILGTHRSKKVRHLADFQALDLFVSQPSKDWKMGRIRVGSNPKSSAISAKSAVQNRFPESLWRFMTNFPILGNKEDFRPGGTMDISPGRETGVYQTL
jgi:hypothetical protein